MAKKASPTVNQDDPEARPDKSEVASLRAMNREERLALLMKDFEATCGALSGPRRTSLNSAPVKPRRKS